MCKTCKKATWAGCGYHIDIVLKNVKEENRCKCRENRAKLASAQTNQVNTRQMVQQNQTHGNGNGNNNVCKGTICHNRTKK